VFRKCFYELSQIPKDEATDIMNVEMKQTLLAYRSKYDDIIADCHKDVSRGLAFQMSDSRDGKPTFSGLRYKIFALILISESLGLTGCHEIIVDVAKLAIRQKDEIQKFSDQLLKFSLIDKASLCNCYVLSAGLYGTCHDKNRPELASLSSRYVKRDLVDYSASATEYDILVRDGLVKPKPNKGFIGVYLFKQSTDDDDDVVTLVKF
jgi:hypothetical protein